jgi:class 3 adenylate cyclase/DNA-binding beta-propeller fold protein YncE
MKRRASAGGRMLATVLFTDIVGSTELSARLEDRHWRDLLARHQVLVRGQLKNFGGREIDTAGDGFFAIFDQPAEAIRCAAAIARATRELGIDVRAGLHTGECEVADNKVRGIAVHIGARVLSNAGAGEVIVSGTLRELVSGSGLTFEDRGTHSLKGVPGEWRLFVLREPEPLPALSVIPAISTERKREWPAVLRARVPLVFVAVGVLLIAVGIGSFLATRGPSFPTGPNTVAVIDPASGEVVNGIGVGAGPGAIAVGEDAMWVANFDDKTVSRLNPETDEEATRFGGIGTPTAVAVGEDAVWVVDGLGDTISLIDPGRNQVVEMEVGVGGNDVAVGFDAVWVADGTADAVLRVDPTTREVEATTELPSGHEPAAIAVGHGAVWVANGLGNTVSQIDPTTGDILTLNIPLCCPTDIAVDRESIWVTSTSGDTVSKIDPNTRRVALSKAVGDGPLGIVATDDGVWVAISRAGSVWRLDPETGEVTDRIPVDGAPQDVAAGDDGRIWVTVAPPS